MTIDFLQLQHHVNFYDVHTHYKSYATYIRVSVLQTKNIFCLLYLLTLHINIGRVD